MNKTLVSVTPDDGHGENKPLVVPGFIVDDSGIYKEESEGVRGPWIGSWSTIVGTYEDIETEKGSSLMAYMDHGTLKHRKLAPDSLQPNKLMDLVAYGIQIDPHFRNDFSVYLQRCRSLVPIRITYKKIGWFYYSGTLVFGMRDAVDKNGQVVGEYAGDLNLNTAGSYTKWQDFARDELVGHLGLEVVLGAAVAAMITKYAQIVAPELDLGGAIFSLCDESSTGKTTALMAAMSIYGLSNSGDGQSLVMSLNATEKALLEAAGNLNGVPFALDELGANSDANITSLIYSLANGVSRSRLSQSSELQRGSGFSTWTLTTAETSIRTRMNTTSGLAVRVLEFTNLPLTENAEHARRIKDAVSRNYGVVAPVLANALLNTDSINFVSLFQSATESLKINSNDPLLSRLTQPFASILMGVQLLNQVLNLGIDELRVKEYLRQQLVVAIDYANPAETQYQKLVAWVNSHRNSFDVDGTVATGEEVYGEIFTEDLSVYVKIDAVTFTRILDQIGLSAPKTILARLRDAGRSKHETSRLWWRDANHQKYAIFKIREVRPDA